MGERVGDEKIAERRVATKAGETSQSSSRVFSEIFCSTHPERGASPPTVQVPPERRANKPGYNLHAAWLCAFCTTNLPDTTDT